MKRWRFAFVLGFGSLLSANGQTPPKNPVGHGSEVVAAGRAAFNRMCTGCHGVDGGEGERAPALVGDRRFFRLSEGALYDTIENGIPGTGMMAMGKAIDDGDVWRIVVFIRAMRGSASDTDVQGDAQHGKEIFAGKGGCIKCHTLQGKGGTIGPDLSNVGAEMTLKHLRDSLTSDTPIARGYKPVTVVLINGQTIKGVAKNEDAFSLQLLDYDNHLHLIDKEEVQKEDEGTKSLMPHDYDKQLSKEEFQDLLAMLAKQTREGGHKRIDGDGEVGR
ncbi:MAG: c-type cytochrome [Acidobacteria bacterium]|nr:c-type cytochrome [Acidobacteriota bacterium]